jgi:ABC-2 type transport system ATP-binding protein
VYGTDTGRVEKVLSPLDGSATLTFDLDAVVFGNGPHFVHAFLSDERGEYIALRRDAARFVMEDDPTHLGTHRIPTLISEDHTA